MEAYWEYLGEEVWESTHHILYYMGKEKSSMESPIVLILTQILVGKVRGSGKTGDIKPGVNAGWFWGEFCGETDDVEDIIWGKDLKHNCIP